MKQRVMIAMALACDPELLIAMSDYALDVTIQAQILDLLRELQKTTGMSVLLITHDLAVVAEMAQRIAHVRGRNRRVRVARAVFQEPCPPVFAQAVRLAARQPSPARRWR